MNAQHIANWYVCSVCYGEIVESAEGRAVCSKFQDDHAGFVTRAHAEIMRRQAEDMLAFVKYFYSKTKWAEALGLEPAKMGAELQEQFNRNKRALGRDDSGLF